MTGGRVRGRIPALDGARGVAAVCIVVAHSVAFLGPRFVVLVEPAAEAVVFFFALSGFLIHLPFARAIEDRTALPDLRRYAGQRIRRIFPAWLVTFLLADLVLGAVYLLNEMVVAQPRSDVGTGRFTGPVRLLEHLSLVANLMPSQLQTGINPSWSLTTELTFYLVLPVLAWLAWRSRGDGLVRALAPGLVLLVVGLAGTLWSEHLIAVHRLGVGLGRFGPNPESVLSRSLLVQGGAFGAGMVVAALFAALEQGRLPGLTPRRVRGTGVLLLAGAGLGGLLAIHRASQLDAWLFAIVSGAFLLLVVEPTARRRTNRFVRIWDWPPFQYLGLISLSIYLWHYPVLILLARHRAIAPPSAWGTALNTLLVLALSVGAASLSYRYVEAPFLRSRHEAARTPSRS